MLYGAEKMGRLVAYSTYEALAAVHIHVRLLTQCLETHKHDQRKKKQRSSLKHVLAGFLKNSYDSVQLVSWDYVRLCVSTVRQTLVLLCVLVKGTLHH